MLESPLAPYLLWAKSRPAAGIDLAGSNLLACSLDDLPGAREAVDLTAPNDDGYRPLVEAIARHYGIAPARIATATGCSGANFLAAAALLGAGDDVLVERPGYDPLVGACRLMGARVRRFDRRFEAGYEIDLDALARHLAPATRLIVVTTPHNPSGCRLSRATLEALGALMDGRGWVLVDEVYLDAANLAAGRAATDGSAARLDGPFIVTSSLTKSYGLGGLKCGWAIGSPNAAERFRRTRDVVDNCGSAPADRLGAHAFGHLGRAGERARRLLSRNLALARGALGAQPSLELAGPPEASVVFPRLAGGLDGDVVADRLLTRDGVAVVPGSFFGAPSHIRIGLAGDSDALERGLVRLAAALAPRADIG
jgi:aspartate/methionine/tyrosine aminotransferase